MVYVSRDSDWLKGLRENFLDQSKSDILPLSGRGGGASFRDQRGRKEGRNEATNIQRFFQITLD